MSASLEERENTLNLTDEDSAKTSESVPKRSLEKIARSASIDSNGELYFARSNSSGSISSRKLSRSNSSFEESLRERRESLGLLSLHEEALVESAPKVEAGTTKRRRKLGQIRMRLPQADLQISPVCPIKEGDNSCGIVNEGVPTQDLRPNQLFNDFEDDDDDNIADSVSDGYLEATQNILTPALVLQASDAYKENNDENKPDQADNNRKCLPINPQNLNDLVKTYSDEKKYDSSKEKMVVSDVPFIPYVRKVPVFVSYLEYIKSTKATIYVSGIQAFLINGQNKTFETDSFDVTFNETKNLSYCGKLIIHIALKCLSIGFALLKGKYDSRLPWPFNMMLLFKLVNAEDRKSTIRGIRSDLNGSKFPQCLSRPSNGRMMAIGFAHFLSTASLTDGFIENDSLKIIARLSPKQYVSLSEVKFEFPSIVKV